MKSLEGPVKAYVHAVPLAICLMILSVALVRPSHNFDTLFYVASAQHGTLEQIHQRTYALVQEAVPPVTWRDLTGGSELNSDLYANPWDFAQQIPFYSTKPLYILSVQGLSSLGLGPVRATIWISVFSAAIIALVIWLWIGRYASGWQHALLSSAVMFTPAFWRLARLSSPDSLATALLLASFYGVIEKRKVIAPSILTLLSIFARTDCLIWAGTLFLLMLMLGRIRLLDGVLLSALAVASYLLIDKVGGAYPWTTLFYSTCVIQPLAPANTVIHVSARDYLAQIVKVLLSRESDFFLVYGFLAALALRHEPWRRPVALLLVAVAIHVLAMPVLFIRYLALPYLIFAIGASTSCFSKESAFNPIGP